MLIHSTNQAYGSKFGFGKPTDRRIPKKVEGDAELVCDRTFEDFSTSEVGSFPKGWKTKYEHNFEKAKRNKIYVVEQDKVKGKVLRGTYGDNTITVLRSLEDWDLEEYPGFQWDWKAVVLPTGGDEANASTNDSAASVYIVWNVGFPMQAKALRFAWSSTQPSGSVIKRRADHDNIFILESGSGKLNQWKTERINVRDLYNEHILLSKKYKQPFALALTTDADNTQSKAQAYYGNFKLCREVAKK